MISKSGTVLGHDFCDGGKQHGARIRTLTQNELQKWQNGRYHRWERTKLVHAKVRETKLALKGEMYKRTCNTALGMIVGMRARGTAVRFFDPVRLVRECAWGGRGKSARSENTGRRQVNVIHSSVLRLPHTSEIWVKDFDWKWEKHNLNVL